MRTSYFGAIDNRDRTLDTLSPRGRATDRAGRGSYVTRQRGDDRYVIEEEIARGGQAVILRALDRRLHRPVAIKQPHELTGTHAQRFLTEAMITARLAHPSIVPVHDVGTWADGSPYFAMKLIRGETLRERLSTLSGCSSSRRELLSVVVDVVDAVAYAHSERIVHLDLKPSNVLLSDFGQTIVIDWGIAEELHDRSESKAPLTISQGESRSVCGTRGFMAPEQAAGRCVDERTDVYALGVLLSLVLNGQLPLASGSPHPPSRDDRRAFDLLGPTIDSALSLVVERARADDPADRFASGAQMLAALQAALRGSPLLEG